MFCTECGVKNSADNKFCRQCGHSLEKARISEEAYTRALPEDEQAIELLEAAYALHRKGDVTGAAQTCERALQIAPGSAAAHSLLGQLYAAQGNRERAIREYEQVLRLNPGSIADRVKLDELRDEGLPKAKRSASVLPIGARARAASVLPLAGRENVAPSMMTLISIGAAMIALTAAGVALSRAGHSGNGGASGGAGNGANTNRNAANPVAPNPAPMANTAAVENVAPATNGMKTTVAGPVTPGPALKTAALPANAFGAGAGLPAMKTNAPAFPPPGPPTATLPAINPPPAVSVAKMNSKKTAGKKSASAPPTDNRIVLSGDGNSGDSDHYTIKISAGGAASPGGGSGKNSVVMAHSGGAENPPAPSSRSAVSIADDLRYKGEFDKAIQMYQRALPDAGDGAAHIYQQMAYCFQAKGDKNSAKVNYERAIEAYQKLAQSGQNAESAQSAIRVCQRGIKVCE